MASSRTNAGFLSLLLSVGATGVSSSATDAAALKEDVPDHGWLMNKMCSEIRDLNPYRSCETDEFQMKGKPDGNGCCHLHAQRHGNALARNA